MHTDIVILTIYLACRYSTIDYIHSVYINSTNDYWVYTYGTVTDHMRCKQIHYVLGIHIVLLTIYIVYRYSTNDYL